MIFFTDNSYSYPAHFILFIIYTLYTVYSSYLLLFKLHVVYFCILYFTIPCMYRILPISFCRSAMLSQLFGSLWLTAEMPFPTSNQRVSSWAGVETRYRRVHCMCVCVGIVFVFGILPIIRYHPITRWIFFYWRARLIDCHSNSPPPTTPHTSLPLPLPSVCCGSHWPVVPQLRRGELGEYRVKAHSQRPVWRIQRQDHGEVRPGAGLAQGVGMHEAVRARYCMLVWPFYSSVCLSCLFC